LNILVTGRGSSGSWKVRGEQLGGAIGARVKPNASEIDVDWADIVIVVKRPIHNFMPMLKKSGKPWVWDVVDFYPQPACSNWNSSQAIKWVWKQIKTYQPTGIIWPNRKMAEDCSRSENDIVLYHHHWPGIQINPIRDRITVVGYEGSAKYLGRWEKEIRKQCDLRGWKLAINEGCHADWDICVAFRDLEFNGYPQKNWKSNVKLANAQGSGTPFIGAFECGYTETRSGAEMYASDPSDIGRWFDRIESQETRKALSDALLSKAYSLDDASRDLKTYLELMV
jgi:hypothetical protein